MTVVRDGDFVGVPRRTMRARGRARWTPIKAEWKTTPQPSGAELFDVPEEERRRDTERAGELQSGSVENALRPRTSTTAATYTVAYIAHAPLEPRAAVAEWKDGKLTVWTGTQRPFGVRSELAEAFRIPEEQVRVIVPDTGSGYGGKHTGEAAIEAARLAKAAGKPVKLVWTREEEFTWAYFRPAGVIEVSSGASNDGTITAWEFHNYNSGRRRASDVLHIPNQQIVFHEVESPLRQGSYRGLAATANHFAREVAHGRAGARGGHGPAGISPEKSEKRAAARGLRGGARKSSAGARAKRRREHGFGMGCGYEKCGYVATCAEVAVERPVGEV